MIQGPASGSAPDGLGFASPFVFMGLRYLIAGAMLLSISRRIILTKSLLFLSVVTVTSTVFWAYGLLYVSPSESAVLSYSMPLFSLPIAFLMVSEKPSRMEILGIIIGFAGVLMVPRNPDAVPELSRDTEPITELVFGAENNPNPMPI